jgi:hypothetical protein
MRLLPVVFPGNEIAVEFEKIRPILLDDVRSALDLDQKSPALYRPREDLGVRLLDQAADPGTPASSRAASKAALAPKVISSLNVSA